MDKKKDDMSYQELAVWAQHWKTQYDLVLKGFQASQATVDTLRNKIRGYEVELEQLRAQLAGMEQELEMWMEGGD